MNLPPQQTAPESSAYKKACIKLEILIFAANRYHRHVAIEKCPGCVDCPEHRAKYYYAKAEYEQQVREMLNP